SVWNLDSLVLPDRAHHGLRVVSSAGKLVAQHGCQRIPRGKIPTVAALNPRVLALSELQVSGFEREHACGKRHHPPD
ncbi:unnamed protein product, partial [Amoebophrya sp. A120]